MQPIGTVWTTLVKEHLEIICVKFDQNPMSAFDFDLKRRRLSKKVDERRTTMENGQRLVASAKKKYTYQTILMLTMTYQLKQVKWYKSVKYMSHES